MSTDTKPRTWDDYYRAVGGIMNEMIGAARYLRENPEYAPDERVAETFREYVARAEAVERPDR